MPIKSGEANPTQLVISADANYLLTECERVSSEQLPDLVQRLKALREWHNDYKSLWVKSAFTAAFAQQTELVIALLQQRLITADSRDEFGNTLLHVAAETGDIKLFNYCKTRTPMAVKNQAKQTPLHVAVAHNQVEIAKACMKLTLNATERAIFTDAQAFLTQGTSVALEMPPLHYAVYAGHLEMVKYLLTCQEINQSKTHLKETVATQGNLIHLAVVSGNVAVLRYLLTHTNVIKLINARNDLNFSPVGLAIYTRQLALIPLLLKAGADFISADEMVIPTLHCAIYTGQQALVVEVVAYLQAHPEALKWNLETEFSFKHLPLLQTGEAAQADRVCTAEGLADLLRQPLEAKEARGEGLTPLEAEQRSELASILGFLKTLKQLAKKAAFDEHSQHWQTLIEFIAEARQEAQTTRSPQRYQNLVLKGGGPKGIAYVGAIQALEAELGAGLPYLVRIAGTSAGAITALALALGLHADELQQELQAKVLTEFIEASFDPKQVRAAVNQPGLGTVVKAAWDIVQRRYQAQRASESLPKAAFHALQGTYAMDGLCAGEDFRAWVEDLIYRSTGIQHLTLGELHTLAHRVGATDPQGHTRYYKELYVVATELLPQPAIRVFSSERAQGAEKNWVISDLIRASMSIPGVFKPHRLRYKDAQGQVHLVPNSPLYVDGGLLCNFPIQLFDEVSFQNFGLGQRQTTSFQLPNRQTLGLSLYTPPDLKTNDSPITIHTVKDLVTCLGAIYNEAEAIYAHLLRPLDRQRTVEISNLGVGLLDFDLSSERQAALIEAGRVAVTRFFTPYSEMKIATEPQAQPTSMNVRPLASRSMTSPAPVQALAQQWAREGVFGQVSSAFYMPAVTHKQGKEEEKKENLQVNEDQLSLFSTDKIHSPESYLAYFEPHWPVEFKELCVAFEDAQPLINYIQKGYVQKNLNDNAIQWLILCSAYYGHKDHVKLLAKMNFVNIHSGVNGLTVMHVAALKGESTLVRELETLNFDMGQPAQFGPYRHVQPIHCAIVAGHIDLFLALQDKTYFSYIHYQYGEGNYNFVELGWLSLAVCAGQIEVVQVLLRQYAGNSDILTQIDYVKGMFGGNILHLAVEVHQQAILDIFLSYSYFRDKKYLEGVTSDGLTPFALAAKFGNLEAMHSLKAKGANLEARVQGQQYQDYRPLHLATESAQRQAVAWLIRWGCDLDASCWDTEGKKPKQRTAQQLAHKRSKQATKAAKCSSSFELRQLLNRQSKIYHTIAMDLEKFIENKFLKLSEATNAKKVIYKNLVFKGGGFKEIVYVGALIQLMEQWQSQPELQQFANIERVGGTSTGAITAALFAVGYTPQQMKALLLDPQNQPKRFLEGHSLDVLSNQPASKKILSVLNNPMKYTDPFQLAVLFANLYDKKALCTGDDFLNWIEGYIRQMTGIAWCTFGELKTLIDSQKVRKFRHLHVVTIRVNPTTAIEVLSSEDPRYAHYSIAHAIRASMSIPFVFKPAQLNQVAINDQGQRQLVKAHDGYYIDGGFLANYPLELFDEARYVYQGLYTFRDQSSRRFPVYNEATLGFYIQPEKPLDQAVITEASKLSLLGALKALYTATEKHMHHLHRSERRTIAIDPVGVELFDFDLSPEQFSELVKLGSRAVLMSNLVSSGSDINIETPFRRLKSVRPANHEQELPAQIESIFDGLKSPNWNDRISTIWSSNFLLDSNTVNPINERLQKKLIKHIDEDPVLLVKAVAAHILIKKMGIEEEIIVNLFNNLALDYKNAFTKRIEYRETEIICELLQSPVQDIFSISLYYLNYFPIGDSKVLEKCQALREEIKNDTLLKIVSEVCQRLQEQIEYQKQQAEESRRIRNNFTANIRNRYEDIQQFIKASYGNYHELNLSILKKYNVTIDLFRCDLSQVDTVIEENNHTLNQNRNADLGELFQNPIESYNNSKKVLIVGDPGVGKSTLCQSIVYQWSQENLWSDRFDWVFLIPMRNLTSYRYLDANNYQLEDMIEKECFAQTVSKEFSTLKSEYILQSIRELLASSGSRCLFIIDGYNELSSESPASTPDYLQKIIDNLISDHRYSVLVTTRPHFLGDKRFDTAYKLNYFSPEKIQSYIESFFTDNDDASKSLRTMLEKEPGLYKIARIPLNLLLLCVSWKFNYDHSSGNLKIYSLIDIYEEFVSNTIDDQPAVSLLEKCAFECLKESRLTFNQDEVKHDTYNLSLNECPFIKMTQVESAFEKARYVFLYQGIQEFLAAKYLANHLHEQQEFIKNEKYNIKYLQLFSWAAGCLRKDSDKLEAYFSLLLAQPRELYGYYECILFIKCIDLSSLENFKKLHVATEIIEIITYWMQAYVNDLSRNKLENNYEFLLQTIKQSTEITKLDEIKPLIAQIANQENPPLTLSFMQPSVGESVTQQFLTKNTLPIEATSTQRLENSVPVGNVNVAQTSKNNENANPVINDSLIQKPLEKGFSSIQDIEQWLENFLKPRKPKDLTEQELNELIEAVNSSRKMVDKSYSNLSILTDMLLKLHSEIIQEIASEGVIRTSALDKLLTELIYSVIYLTSRDTEKFNSQVVKVLAGMLESTVIHAGQRQIVEAILSSLVSLPDISLSPFLPGILNILDSSKDDIYLDKLQIELTVLKQLEQPDQLTLSRDDQDKLIVSLNNLVSKYVKFMLEQPNTLYLTTIRQNLFTAAFLLCKWNSSSLLTTEVLIELLSLVGEEVSDELRSRAIKYIGNTNLAPFLTSFNRKVQSYLFENMITFFKATTIQSLIQEVMNQKEYRDYYPFIEKLIAIKKIAVIEIKLSDDDKRLKFFEDNKTYAFKADDFPEFFLKLKYTLKNMNNRSVTTIKTHVLIDWLHKDLTELKENTVLLDTFLRRKQQEAIIKTELVKGKFKALSKEKQKAVISFFANNVNNAEVSVIKRLLSEQTSSEELSFQDKLTWKK